VPRSFLKSRGALQDAIILFFLLAIVIALAVAFDFFNLIITLLYRHDTWRLDIALTVALYLVAASMIFAWRRHRELVDEVRRRELAEHEKQRLVPKLENALADAAALRKLLPICTSCKRVRDSSGHWSEIGVYLESHLSTRIDDGICPECAREAFTMPTSSLRSRPTT
jgi:hypothetical protein